MFYILTRTAAANIFFELYHEHVWKISKLFKINDASWPIPRNRILSDMNPSLRVLSSFSSRNNKPLILVWRRRRVKHVYNIGRDFR